MAKAKRIIVIDDHPLMREGIIATFAEHQSLFEVVASGGTASEAISLAKENEPDLILIDLNIPGGGLEAVAHICMSHPNMKLVVLTVSERATHIALAFESGAKGYLLKGISGADLIKAISNILNGQTYVSPELAGRIFLPHQLENAQQSEAENRLHSLSAREHEILELLNLGKSNKEIAIKVNISEKTVKYYLTAIFEKLAVKSRLEAVIFYRDAKRKSEFTT